MSRAEGLKTLVEKRLAAAAEEIFLLFQEVFAEYREEITRQQNLEKVTQEHKRNHADAYGLILRIDDDPPAQEQESQRLCIKIEPEQLHALQNIEFITEPMFIKTEEEIEQPQELLYDHSQTVVAEDTGIQDRHDKTSESSEEKPKENKESSNKPNPKPKSYPNSLKKKVLDRSKKPFCCSACGKRFSQNSNLKTHMRIHTGEKPFVCSICNKSFIQKIHLKYHMVHHTGEKLFNCTTCKERFNWLYQLKNHQCVDKTAGQIQGTKSTENLQTHAENKASCSIAAQYVVSENNVESKNDRKLWSCPYCSRTFAQEVHLQEHLKDHAGETSFPCSFCNHVFFCKKQLQKHKATHMIEKKLSCGVCKKMFSWPSQLRVHKCVSEGSSQPHCNQTQPLLNNSSLQILATSEKHQNKRQFPCSQCDKVFSLKVGLLRHLRVHMEGKLHSGKYGAAHGQPQGDGIL